MSEYIVDVEEQRWCGSLTCGEKIVRCRDCKHFTTKGTYRFGDGRMNENYCKYIRGWMMQITPDGYCAWGERKEGK